MDNLAGAQVVGRDPQIRPDRDLTIVIPTFGCAEYLPAAVESTLHSPAARILITDDGSGPDVHQVAERYHRRYPERVRLLRSEKRRGVSRNVNEAVREVRTPFFAKLDGDDVLIPGHIEAAFRVIAERPKLALIAGHERRIAANDVLQFQPELFTQTREQLQVQIMSDVDAFRFILNWRPNPCSSGAIYRTEAFREVGGFDTAIEWGEDWEIWLRLAERWELAYCHAPSALYRIHDQSATARNSRHFRLCFGYEAVYRRAAEICSKHPEVRPLLRRNFLALGRLYLTTGAKQTLRFPKGTAICGVRAARALATAAQF